MRRGDTRPIAEVSAVLRDPRLDIDRRIIQGRPVPTTMIGVYEAHLAEASKEAAPSAEAEAEKRKRLKAESDAKKASAEAAKAEAAKAEAAKAEAAKAEAAKAEAAKATKTE